MNHTYKTSGFTLVELMLAMGFVSALLLAIAMTVIQIGNIYTRGMISKNVNQVGSSIANDLKRSISSVKAFNAAPNGTNYIKNTESGRLCTGKYSYVWNYGRYLRQPSTSSNFIKYKGLGSGENPKIFFAKVYDANNLVCTKDSTSKYPDIDRSKAVELIGNEQFDLALHGLGVKYSSSAEDSAIGQQLYSIDFYLGTDDTALKYDAGSGVYSCEVSAQNTDLTYCSVYQFNIIARAGSATN